MVYSSFNEEDAQFGISSISFSENKMLRSSQYLFGDGIQGDEFDRYHTNQTYQCFKS